MASENDMDDGSQLSATDSSDDEAQDAPVESLVAGRERRKTAGNRYDRDMVLEETVNEDEPDEVTLLFAENEEGEDEEFKSDAEDDDVMSSSDDDDQGPNAAADDMEGEQELQTQAKQERARKRKADLALTSVAGLRKKLKTDPTRPGPMLSVPARPSKKKERVTWVHDQDSGRSSLRKQTIAHRAETIARLKESEAQSKKLKALKEKRDRERARDAPKELTQSDRLAEAARVERQNAKSLNRWEAMEKKRQEEQAAKLAALKDRKLEGPVVTLLSQKVKWYGPEPSKVGTKDGTEPTAPKKRGRKSKAELQLIAAEKAAESTNSMSAQTTTGASTPAAIPVLESSKATPIGPGPGPGLALHNEQTSTPTATNIQPSPTQPRAEDPAATDTQSPAIQTPTTEPLPIQPPTTQPLLEDSTIAETQAPSTPSRLEDGHDSFLQGIHEYANLPADSSDSGSKHVSPAPEKADEIPKAELQEGPKPDGERPPQIVAPPADPLVEPSSLSHQSLSNPSAPEAGTERIEIKTEAPAEQTPAPATAEAGVENPRPLILEIDPSSEPGPEPVPEPPRIEEDSTRNLIILEKFDELSGKSKLEYSFFSNKRATTRTVRAVKTSQELCPITTSPVRYRDPATGIAFANALAYKKLQDLKEHKYAWSSMLGCYVGREDGLAARGVPEGWH